MRDMRSSTFIGVMLFLAGMPAGAVSCSAHTPEQAAAPQSDQISISSSTSIVGAATSGYRTRRVLVDATLGKRWAMVEDCNHPGRPLQIIAMAMGDHVALPAIELSEGVGIRPAVSATSVETTYSGPALAMERANPAGRRAETPKPRDLTLKTLVRAGDRVYLWRMEENVRLKIEAISLDYGRAGQVIHLRRAGQNEMLAGIVMGPDSAELMP